jgi:predicted GIY-YIG superfamily endonuclease
MKQPAVHIMASKRNGMLYTGRHLRSTATSPSDRERLMPGFTSRYGCNLLVWDERHDEMPAAIVQEKQIEAGSRGKKLRLIEGVNPHWRDRYDDLV